MMNVCTFASLMMVRRTSCALRRWSLCLAIRRCKMRRSARRCLEVRKFVRQQKWHFPDYEACESCEVEGLGLGCGCGCG